VDILLGIMYRDTEGDSVWGLCLGIMDGNFKRGNVMA